MSQTWQTLHCEICPSSMRTRTTYLVRVSYHANARQHHRLLIIAELNPTVCRHLPGGWVKEVALLGERQPRSGSIGVNRDGCIFAKGAIEQLHGKRICDLALHHSLEGSCTKCWVCLLYTSDAADE